MPNASPSQKLDEISKELETLRAQCLSHPEKAAEMLQDGLVQIQVSLEELTELVGGMTEAEQAEEALRESEGKYHLLFNSISEGLAIQENVYDENGKPVDIRLIDVNPAYERQTGLKQKDVIGKLRSELLGNPDRYWLSWLERYEKVLVTGEPARIIDYSNVLDRYYEVFIFTIKPPRYGVIFTDITERKRAEEALRESEERFRALSETSPVGVGVSSADGVIVYTNPAY